MPLLSIITALVVTVISVPVARRFPISGRSIDVTIAPRGERRSVARLTGVAVITGTLVGGVILLGGGGGRIAAAAGSAVAVGLFGLVSDARPVRYFPRLMVQTVAASVVAAVGIRADVTAVTAIDFAITVLGLVTVTNAFSLIDAESGVAAALGAIGALATFVLAALGHQSQLAHLSGALAGACIGYLLCRHQFGAILMGRCGTFFVGFTLGVAALELDLTHRLGRGGDALVPASLFSLPTLNLILVLVGRARRNLPVGQPADDQLSQRLVRSGTRHPFTTLVAVEFVLALLAVATGRSMLRGVWAVLIGAVVLAALVIRTARVRTYTGPVVGLPRGARRVALSVVGLIVVGSAAAGVSLLAARGPLRNGADAATAALNAARAGDYRRADSLFGDSERFFRIGRTRLEGPLPSLGLVVPGVSSNIRAARLLAGVGTDLAASGRTLASEVRPERLRMQAGAFPVAEITRLAPTLRHAAAVMTSSERRLRAAHLAYLFAPVRDAITTVQDKLDSVSATTRRAADAATLAPRILGEGQPRRYLLAIQNPAESRATGGFLGNFGELVAQNGRVSLEKFGSASDLRDGGVPFADRTLDAPADFLARFSDRMPEIKSWLHVNITPDFPTAARLMESLYPQSGGEQVDGVLAVDPVGLSALLKLTGPVSVAGWPDPLTAQNIVRVTTRDQYEPDRTYGERRDFLGAVAETVWRRVSSTDLGTPYTIANALGPAAGGRHIQFSLRNPTEARLVRDVGIAGAVGPGRSDSLMFVNHNAAGNKVDVYLRRSVAYHVRVQPEPEADGSARVTAVVDVTLHNDSPPSGLPEGVLGDVNQPIKPGENFSFASLYSPLTAVAVFVDGKRYLFRSDKDVGELAHSTFLRVPPGKELKMRTLLTGRIRLVGGDTYVLDIAHQARLAADQVTVSIELPKGWEIVGGQGMRRTGPGRAIARFDQQADRAVSLRIRSAGLSGLWAAVTK